MSAAYQTTFSIPPTHPALPGHFPGDPLVPGVVLLEQVALALRAWRDERLVRETNAGWFVLGGEQTPVRRAHRSRCRDSHRRIHARAP